MNMRIFECLDSWIIDRLETPHEVWDLCPPKVSNSGLQQMVIVFRRGGKISYEKHDFEHSLYILWRLPKLRFTVGKSSINSLCEGNPFLTDQNPLLQCLGRAQYNCRKLPHETHATLDVGIDAFSLKGTNNWNCSS